ncbi:hypothetical protein CDIK_0577 [Cucumispora dikerogammari]|nr:hypothetical protein CDIK_0577 [Cucumispora dikerogammari]
MIYNCVLKIKKVFKEVNFLISTLKCAVVKSNKGKSKFFLLPTLLQLIITKWNSWLLACKYYYEYLPAVRNIVSSFEDNDVIVHNAKIAVKAETLHNDLIYIQKNYGFLRDIIKQSEEKLFRIEDAIKILSKFDSF